MLKIFQEGDSTQWEESWRDSQENQVLTFIELLEKPQYLPLSLSLLIFKIRGLGQMGGFIINQSRGTLYCHVAEPSTLRSCFGWWSEWRSLKLGPLRSSPLLSLPWMTSEGIRWAQLENQRTKWSLNYILALKSHSKEWKKIQIFFFPFFPTCGPITRARKPVSDVGFLVFRPHFHA